MSDAPLAAGSDRLPWLADEPPPRATRRSNAPLGVAIAATIVVAGAAYWMGARSSDQSAEWAPTARQETIPLPEARPVQPEVKLAPEPQLELAPAPPMPVIREAAPVALPKARHETQRAPQGSVEQQSADGETASISSAVEQQPTEDKAAAASPAIPAVRPPHWLVWVGAFATAHQAKRGWWWMVRMNPTLQRLPAVVVPVQSLRNARTYYRLQIATSSQAHSAVLCQRLRMVALSCVVVDGASSTSEGAQ